MDEIPNAPTRRLERSHPDHAEVIRSLMWMGVDGGIDYFKHRDTRKTITYDALTGTVEGDLETGEKSTNPEAVFREVATL